MAKRTKTACFVILSIIWKRLSTFKLPCISGSLPCISGSLESTLQWDMHILHMCGGNKKRIRSNQLCLTSGQKQKIRWGRHINAWSQIWISIWWTHIWLIQAWKSGVEKERLQNSFEQFHFKVTTLVEGIFLITRLAIPPNIISFCLGLWWYDRSRVWRNFVLLSKMANGNLDTTDSNFHLTASVGGMIWT